MAGRVERWVRRHITERKMDIVEEMRGFEIDHEPDGWPAVRMRQVSALCNEIDRLRISITRAQDLILKNMPTAAIGCLENAMTPNAALTRRP